MPAKATRRQAVLLAVLVVALILVLVYQFGAGSGAPAGSPGAAPAIPAREAAARDRAESVPALRLEALEADRADPAGSGRNLFREKPKAPPPPPPRATPPPPPPDPNPQPPPPPPIALKLVAIVEGSGRPIAALTDDRDVFWGREGDVIEGRYRIVKINVESIDIAYLDGRGQRRLGLLAK
jgi:hypothetical protein